MLGLALTLAAVVAPLLTPKLHAVDDAPDLTTTLPKAVGDWRAIETALVHVQLTTGTSTDQPYDQSVMRSYTDGHANVIHIAVAWGRQQRQEVKIHRPELCYPAQGFQVLKLQDTTFPIADAAGSPITGKRMITKDRSGQIEAVSYWIRIGGVYSDSAWQTRKHIFTEGLAGRIPDGVLVRVSQRVPTASNMDEVFQRQEAFAAQLVQASEPRTRDLLARNLHHGK